MGINGDGNRPEFIVDEEKYLNPCFYDARHIKIYKVNVYSVI